MLDQETLKKLVHYDPETGIMTWLPRQQLRTHGEGWNTKYANKVIEKKDKNGYFVLSTRIITGKLKNYPVHRLAWLYMHGEFPEGSLDHINRIKTDNRIDNLRLANVSLNCHNIELTTRNKSGVKGVNWNSKSQKWQASIRKGEKPIHLGYFDNIEDAENAYRTASIQYAKEFSIYYESRIG